jgi:glycine hydroxymethyltransferase
MDQIFKIIAKEKKRQREQLEMIPSENFASAAVMKAVGSCLMNKYAEGYPRKRYYQGNRNMDQIEDLCRERCLQAFGLDPGEWGVNVQPHSGCEANLAVYNALLNPGDKILSMYLPDGGHLSHGWQLPGKKITLVSKIFKVEFYHVDKKTLVFDYDRIERQALKFKPKLIISGGTAYPREIKHQRLAQIAKKAGAYYMADIAHEAGLIAAGANQSPLPYADVVTFTTHKTFRGPRGAVIIAKKELIDKINFSVFPGQQGGPHLHSIAGMAVAAAEMMTPAYKKYAFQIVKNAKVLSEELKKGSLKVVSGGTDKHLVLLDLRPQNLSGWTVAWALEEAGIIANRNTVPYDSGSPFYPSGLRLGTPALTSRGMKEKEMKQIAKWILKVVGYLQECRPAHDEKIKPNSYFKALHQKVAAFAKKFPVPGI